MTTRENLPTETGRLTRVIPGALNCTLAVFQLLVNVFQFFILPLYLLPQSLWWGLVLAPVAALNNSFWALIHEAIHDVFSPSYRVNTAAGRLLSIFFGAPFRLLRIPHLLHHKFNRSPLEQGTEIYDPEKTARWRAGLGYYFQILGGLYLLEVLSPLLFYLPRGLLRRLVGRLSDPDSEHGASVLRHLMISEGVQEIRADSMAVFFIFGLSAYCYGEHWRLLLLALMARALLVSFLDNVYHYKTPLNETLSAYNLRLPGVFAKFLLNINLHGVHHKNPNLPWVKLPELFAQQSENFDRNFVAAALRQLCGPVPVSELPSPAAARSELSVANW